MDNLLATIKFSLFTQSKPSRDNGILESFLQFLLIFPKCVCWGELARGPPAFTVGLLIIICSFAVGLAGPFGQNREEICNLIFIVVSFGGVH